MDVSNAIDTLCENRLGHTNWAYMSTLNAEEKKIFDSENLGFEEGGVAFYWKGIDEE